MKAKTQKKRTKIAVTKGKAKENPLQEQSSYLSNSISIPTPNERVDVTATGKVPVEGTVIGGDLYDRVMAACFAINEPITLPPGDPYEEMTLTSPTAWKGTVEPRGGVGVEVPPATPVINNNRLVVFAKQSLPTEPGGMEYEWDQVGASVCFYAYQVPPPPFK